MSGSEPHGEQHAVVKRRHASTQSSSRRLMSSTLDELFEDSWTACERLRTHGIAATATADQWSPLLYSSKPARTNGVHNHGPKRSKRRDSSENGDTHQRQQASSGGRGAAASSARGGRQGAAGTGTASRQLSGVQSDDSSASSALDSGAEQLAVDPQVASVLFRQVTAPPHFACNY